MGERLPTRAHWIATYILQERWQQSTTTAVYADRRDWHSGRAIPAGRTSRPRIRPPQYDHESNEGAHAVADDVPRRQEEFSRPRHLRRRRQAALELAGANSAVYRRRRRAL